ncbi:16S rRNA (cytidine(1402)-2'-O)-methyltransferase [Pediococcus argentinicus]|uniref:Ribosomal RNA small subunit methyltransferase I n=1 Tax=Pediococcus argentinicus TaxID=480391 RepID=A0A0R2NJ17_9LACO|nr:16S rRNA (cytidine(1402)-2'-O)-methyltransferase [Pediococcus argentinicus]KRO25768.1 methyltransferase [Pediococcus argentinicus]NKZ21934.1 16S rRNA (cytidine(1402)-2'-O)-methyltransferase [Pediococcus argentinicus]GEP19103.1 ribosomal RNA small subunit methyltransferase I [Pediococcus argentinicus]
MQTQQSFKEHATGTLYLVPTPIGNLEDMTFRAVNILKDVDLILAEDTRNTQKLLNHFEIETKQLSFHEHNTSERIPEVLGLLKQGQNLAQVSDAGMPSISDPGQELVKAAIEEHLTVVPLPGANAGLTALIASGLVPQPFEFYGFLPRKPKEQKDTLAELKNSPIAIIFYEAPHRLTKTIKNMLEVIGPDRQVVLARELTKRYEEFIRGNLQDVNEWISENEVRGEFVIILDRNLNPEVEDQSWEKLSVSDHVDFILKTEDIKTNEAIKRVAKLRGLAKQEVYQIYHNLKES